MRTLHHLVSLTLILTPAATVQAGQIIAATTGLPSPDVLVDFGANLYPNFTPITTEFPPLVFAHTAYFTTGTSNNLVGGFLTNDFSGPPDTLKIHFNQFVTDVSFVYHQISTSQPSVFRVLLGGVLVDSFSNTSDQFQPNNYFGFTDLLFDELQLDFVSDFNIDTVAYNLSMDGGTATCFGDGSAAPCGCGNEATPGSGGGCANLAPMPAGQGAVLSASGSNSIGADDLVLTADFTTNQPGLFFQGDNSIGGGTGTTFGDGIRCCGANVVRLEIADPPGTNGPKTISTSQPILGTSPPGTTTAGDTRCYQWWYRNPNRSACGFNFNLSNAVVVTWSL